MIDRLLGRRRRRTHVMEPHPARPATAPADPAPVPPEAVSGEPLLGRAILYVSVHENLQDDEVSLLRAAGACVTVVHPHAVVVEAPTPRTMPEALRDRLAAEPGGAAGVDARHPPAWFLAHFDMIIVMHLQEWIADNLGVLRDQRIILRTIGQSSATREAQLATLRHAIEIVRYSPRERRMRNYAGEDALIRFYKDETVHHGWRGGERHVLCFGNDLLKRRRHVNLDFFLAATAGFATVLHGRANDGIACYRGRVPGDAMPELYRDCRVYYSHHTIPASYTLSFIEALMTGCPVVTVGPALIGAADLPDELRESEAWYEIPDIIENGVNGYYANTVGEARGAISDLFSNDGHAAAVSREARRTALELFGRAPVLRGWLDLLLRPARRSDPGRHP